MHSHLTCRENSTNNWSRWLLHNLPCSLNKEFCLDWGLHTWSYRETVHCTRTSKIQVYLPSTCCWYRDTDHKRLIHSTNSYSTPVPEKLISATGWSILRVILADFIAGRPRAIYWGVAIFSGFSSCHSFISKANWAGSYHQCGYDINRWNFS